LESQTIFSHHYTIFNNRSPLTNIDLPYITSLIILIQ